VGRVDGRVAIVTGAARGMGKAEAKLLADEGARVVIADLLDAEGQEVADSLGPSGRFVHTDVRDESAWRHLLDETVSAFGVPDVLINNAGILHVAPIIDMELADFERVLAINLIGPFLGMKIIGRAMADAGRGSIVNISSTGGMKGMSMIGGYVASKWGVRGLTKSAAIELGPSGVRVNSLHPGSVITPLGGMLGHEYDVPPARGQVDPYPAAAAADLLCAGQPVARMARPMEIARMALFLASDDSSYCTAQEFVVDGGSMAGDDLSAVHGS
jgi:3alpha(or 20beta)-hydroxysteroid dehydrogenase